MHWQDKPYICCLSLYWGKHKLAVNTTTVILLNLYVIKAANNNYFHYWLIWWLFSLMNWILIFPLKKRRKKRQKIQKKYLFSLFQRLKWHPQIGSIVWSSQILNIFTLTRRWLSPEPPTIREWINLVNDIYFIGKITFALHRPKTALSFGLSGSNI